MSSTTYFYYMVVDRFFVRILAGSIGWIAGFGQAGSAVFPFITGAMAQKVRVPLIFLSLSLNISRSVAWRQSIAASVSNLSYTLILNTHASYPPFRLVAMLAFLIVLWFVVTKTKLERRID